MSRNILVSKDKSNFIDYEWHNSIEGIDWSTVDAFIFNSTIDDDTNFVLGFGKIADAVGKLIYISTEINPLYYGLFAGVNGDIYDDSEYIEDEETLNLLVESYGENDGMVMKSPEEDVVVISTFLASIARDSVETLSDKIKSPMYVKKLEESLDAVQTALVRTDSVNNDMVDMFSKTSKIVEQLKQKNEEVTKEITQVGEKLDELMSTAQSKSGVFYFSTFTVPNRVQKVLYIRVYSPCRYLYTFLDCYADYLRMSRQYSSKLLICSPKFPMHLKKYGAFPRLATETLSTRGIQDNSTFVTFEPKQEVLQSFFSMNAFVHIVVDMTYGEAPLVKGSTVHTLNALSGISDIEKFGLNAATCIMTQLGPSNAIVIPHLKGFAYTPGAKSKDVPTMPSAKRSKYFESCKDKGYKKLDNVLGISV